jgi:hypothetical protein
LINNRWVEAALVSPDTANDRGALGRIVSLVCFMGFCLRRRAMARKTVKKTVRRASIRTLVGQLDARMVVRVAQAVVDLWVGMHRYARARTTHSEVKNRTLEVLGGGVFEWCWTLKSQNGESVSRDEETVLVVFDHIAQPAQRKSICAKCCQTISMLNERMRAVRRLAVMRPLPREEAEPLWQGVEAFRRAMWRILATGALSEMPGAAKNMKLAPAQLAKLAGVLLERWSVISRTAESTRQSQRVSAKLGQALGLGIFAGVRAQLRKHAEIGVAGLAQWLSQYQPRKRRGFYAELALGIHELAQISAELRAGLARVAPDTAAAHGLRAAIEVIEISVFQILETGLLFTPLG